MIVLLAEDVAEQFVVVIDLLDGFDPLLLQNLVLQLQEVLPRILVALERHSSRLVLQARHFEGLLDHGAVPVERARKAILVDLNEWLLTIISNAFLELDGNSALLTLDFLFDIVVFGAIVIVFLHHADFLAGARILFFVLSCAPEAHLVPIELVLYLDDVVNECDLDHALDEVVKMPQLLEGSVNKVLRVLALFTDLLGEDLQISLHDVHFLHDLLQLLIKCVVIHVLVYEFLADFNLQSMRFVFLELPDDSDSFVKCVNCMVDFCHPFLNILDLIRLNLLPTIVKPLVYDLRLPVEVSLDFFDHICLPLVHFGDEDLLDLVLGSGELMGIDEEVSVHELHAFGSVWILNECYFAPLRYLISHEHLPLHLPLHTATPRRLLAS